MIGIKKSKKLSFFDNEILNRKDFKDLLNILGACPRFHC